MNGGDVMSLRRILGHTTLEMVQNYVHLADSQVKTLHSKFSPIDRLGIGTKRSGRTVARERQNGGRRG